MKNLPIVLCEEDRIEGLKKVRKLMEKEEVKNDRQTDR